MQYEVKTENEYMKSHVPDKKPLSCVYCTKNPLVHMSYVNQNIKCVTVHSKVQRMSA